MLRSLSFKAAIGALALLMSWISITEADVLTVLSGPELTAYREAALGSGQEDPVQPAIDQVTREVRGAVSACARNTLGEGNTIPDELKASALDLIAVRIPQRIGRNPKAVRATAAKTANDLLERVAACKFAIVAPETATSEVTSNPTPSFSGRDRCDTRRSQDGL